MGKNKKILVSNKQEAIDTCKKWERLTRIASTINKRRVSSRLFNSLKALKDVHNMVYVGDGRTVNADDYDWYEAY